MTKRLFSLSRFIFFPSLVYRTVCNERDTITVQFVSLFCHVITEEIVVSDTSALRAEKCTSSLTTAWVSYAYHFEPVPTLNFISHFYFVFSLQRINKLDIIMIILNLL